MMSYAAVCGICIIGAIISLALKRYNPELSLLASVAAGAVSAFIIINSVAPVISEIGDLLNMAELNGEYAQILFKALGICLLCQFSADVCNDAGEKALGSKIMLAGKAAVLLITLPLIKAIAQAVTQLIAVP